MYMVATPHLPSIWVDPRGVGQAYVSNILTCLLINQSNQFHFFSTGVLVSLHKQLPGHEESSKNKQNLLTSRCGHGQLNTEALQQVIAAKWAVDVINLQSGPHDLKIGKKQ